MHAFCLSRKDGDFMIGSFRNEYAFLSNMYPCRVLYDGIMYSNAKAAFQAQKCVDEKQKEKEIPDLYGFLCINWFCVTLTT